MTTQAGPTRWRALFVAVLRESRAARGRLFFFTLCLAVGVAAVVGVTSLVATVRGGLASESRDLLAGDLRVSARRPLPPEVDAFFADVPHRRSEIIELGAMVSRSGASDGAGDSRLVELKVASDTYPLYGTLELEPQLSSADLGAERVFVGPELMTELGLVVGDTLSIGGAEFEIAATVVDEPDRLEFAMTLGARVFMGPEGLARTRLFGEKSRVRYITLVRLEGDSSRERLVELEKGLESALDNSPYVEVRAHTQAQQNVSRSLVRVEEFLGLVALMSLLLGGIGVSQIVRAWLAGRVQGVAVMRCLGFRAREIAGMFLGHLALLAIAGCVVGGVLGSFMPFAARAYAPAFFKDTTLSLWQPVAFARGVGLGLFVAALFSLLPLTAVWRVPPAAVLRAEAVPLSAPRSVRFGAPVALFLGVLVSARVQGGEWLPALIFSAGLLLLAGLLYGGARLVAWFAARLPRGKFGPYVEHGLAALSRPGSGSTGAIVALGLGVMVVLAMYLIDTRMGRALRDALPKNAPSVFLVDVQPDQWDGVREKMQERGADSIDTVPVVMARMRSIDGTSVRELAEARKDEGRAAWVYTREQRLTWMQELPEDNEIIAGTLWSDPERIEVSIEEGFAEDLGVGVGSTLELDIQGIPLELAVTSIRTVEWESFGINFFLVVEPGVLEEAPHFRIAATRLEPAEAELTLQNELAAAYPNVTMLRVRPILEKVASVLLRLGLGVRALGSFTILTGLVILAGAIATTALRRSREAALLKTLGVTRSGVTRLFAFEYALSGLVAGTIGGVGAFALSWGFLEFVAQVDYDLPFEALPLAAFGSALLATLSGLAASVRALAARPLATLRG